MTDDSWVLAQAGDKWFAMKRGGDRVFYDPEEVSNNTARWRSKQHMSEEKAIKMVDRLNRKGPLVHVDGRGKPV